MFTLIVLLAPVGDGFFGRGGVDFWGRPQPDAPPAEIWFDSKAPPPVRRLLEAPTRRNAAAYLEWQHERLRRLRAAFDAVEAVRKPKGGVLLYFSRPGCRWCAMQERELEGLPVRRVPAGSPLWAEHGVRVTPTIVAGDRTFRGFTPRRRLLEALR